MLNNLSSFLNNLKKNIISSESNKTRIAEILSENLGVKIEKNNFILKKESLKISLPSTLKQELLYKKQKILEEFKKENLKIYEIY